MKEQKENAFLETEKLTKLMKKYAVPCVISLLVAALYNIVDQIFIFVFKWGMMGAALATILGQILTAVLAVRYLCHIKPAGSSPSSAHAMKAFTTPTSPSRRSVSICV